MIVRVHGGFLLRRGLWRWLAGWLWEEITLPLVARLARAQRGAFEGERGCLLSVRLQSRAIGFGHHGEERKIRNHPPSNLCQLPKPLPVLLLLHTHVLLARNASTHKVEGDSRNSTCGLYGAESVLMSKLRGTMTRPTNAISWFALAVEAGNLAGRCVASNRQLSLEFSKPPQQSSGIEL